MNNIKIITNLKKLFRNDRNSITTTKQGINISLEKELSIEEMYPNMTDEEVWLQISGKDEGDLTTEELSMKFWMTLHREHLYGRSLAIKDLLNNSYQILNGEIENPFKEPINFSLIYLENYKREKPESAENLIQNAFPLMHQFIYRYFTKQNNEIPFLDNFDEQKAYTEFLFFCKRILLSLYPDKTIRDRTIKLQFKLTSRDLIKFIENE
jgi:hypothetical protein